MDNNDKNSQQPTANNQQPEPVEPSQPSLPSKPDLTEPDSSAVAPETDALAQAELPAPEEALELPQPSIPSQPSQSSELSQPSRDAKGAKWYVVHTYSGHEAKVAATLKQKIDSLKLQDKVLDILVPTQDKIEIKEGRKTTVKEKIFPGYLLIKMLLDDDTWLAVRTTPGITSFVGVANRPTAIPDQEVASIQRFMHMEAPKFKTTFSVGEAVKITDGPFAEFLGSVSEIDEEKGKIKVLVSIFGRETPVELDFLQVAKL